MHVQVDVDQRPVRDEPRRGRVARPAVMPPRHEPAVDLLELVGHAREAELRPQRAASARSSSAAPGRRIEPREVAASVCASPGAYCSPRAAVGEQLRVDRHAAGDRHDPARERAHQHAGVGSTPSEPSTTDVRAGERLLDVVDSASRNRTRSASLCPSVAGAASDRDDHTVARQSSVGRQQPQRSQECSQRRAFLFGDRTRAAAGPRGRRCRAAAAHRLAAGSTTR